MNTDRSTDMNRFDNLILCSVKVEKYGKKHARFLNLVCLYNTEQHLDKNELKKKEREVVNKVIFGDEDGNCFRFKYNK